MGLADKLRERREKYENMGIAKPIKKRKKVESLLEKLKIPCILVSHDTSNLEALDIAQIINLN